MAVLSSQPSLILLLMVSFVIYRYILHTKRQNKTPRTTKHLLCNQFAVSPHPRHTQYEKMGEFILFPHLTLLYDALPDSLSNYTFIFRLCSNSFFLKNHSLLIYIFNFVLLTLFEYNLHFIVLIIASTFLPFLID